MDPTETEAHLRSMLEDAGVDLEQPDPLTTWRVFTEFGAKEIDGIQPDDDGFLFQWGVYGSPGLFNLGFLRQFSFFTTEGDYDHMEQLSCAFHFEPTRNSTRSVAVMTGGSALSQGGHWTTG